MNPQNPNITSVENLRSIGKAVEVNEVEREGFEIRPKGIGEDGKLGRIFRLGVFLRREVEKKEYRRKRGTFSCRVDTS